MLSPYERWHVESTPLLEGVGVFLLGAAIAAHKLVNAFRQSFRNEAR